MLFELGVRFGSSINLFFFVVCAAICGLWAYARLRKNASLSAAPLVAINLGILLIWALIAQLDHDEAVHLHLAWLMSQGQIPFKDFWQHHSPFFWILLEPAVRHSPATAAVFPISRLAQGVIFAANASLGWQIARRAWGRQAGVSIYLLALSSVAIFARFLCLRPDSLMSLFLLATVWFCLDIPGKRITPSFLAGIAFALAASFMIKQYLLFFLPLFAVFLGGTEDRWKKVAAYICGVCAGIVPLVSILVSRGILREFFFWVFGFNRQIVVFQVVFPLLIAAAGGWGAYLLWQRSRSRRDHQSLIVLLAFCLSTVSSLTTTSTVNTGYYLSFWFFMCAIAVCAMDVPAYMERVKSRSARALLAGILGGALLIPNAAYLWTCHKDNYFQDERTIARLMQYCAGDSCLVIMPLHPIFARDTTRLYSAWQYYFAGNFKIVRDDVVRQDLVTQVLERRPAVVQCRYQHKDFLLELYQKKLISASGYKRLVGFMLEHYTRKPLGRQIYYVRTDLL